MLNLEVEVVLAMLADSDGEPVDSEQVEQDRLVAMRMCRAALHFLPTRALAGVRRASSLPATKFRVDERAVGAWGETTVTQGRAVRL